MRSGHRNRIQKKFRSNKGETIAETLVTMIILSLAVLLLAGAVVTSARVNKQAENTDTAFTVGEKLSDGTSSSSTVTVTESGSSAEAATAELPVTVYETKNKYIYYEP